RPRSRSASPWRRSSSRSAATRSSASRSDPSRRARSGTAAGPGRPTTVTASSAPPAATRSPSARRAAGTALPLTRGRSTGGGLRGGGELGEAGAAGGAGDEAEDGRHVGAGQTQVAAGHAADQEAAVADLIKRRRPAADARFEADDGQRRAGGGDCRHTDRIR